MTEDDYNTVRRLHTDIIAFRRYEGLEEVVDGRLRYRNSLVSEEKDLAWFRDFLIDLGRAFPDFEMHIEDLAERDDAILCRYHFRGTHQDTFLGIPATGHAVSVPCLAIYRLKAGRILEMQVEIDMVKVKRYVAAGLRLTADASN